MRVLNGAEIGLMAEIATFMLWHCDATVVLWVSHNADRRLFQETALAFLERNMFVPGYGELPPPKIIQRLVGEIVLDTYASLHILPMTYSAQGRTITRAYIPKQHPGRANVLQDLLVSVVPAIAYGGTLIRY